MVESWRKQRKARIAKGLCVTCGTRPARPDRLDCQPCADEKRVKAATVRAERIKRGRCVVCGDKALPGRRKCGWCNKAHNVTCHDRYHALKDDGKCPRCQGKPQAGFVFCKKCRNTYARVNRERTQRYRRRVVRIAEWRRVWSSNPNAVAHRFEKLMRGKGA